MGVIETAKEVVALAQKLDNIELVKTILQLQRECYDLVFQNRELREQVVKLDEALKLREQLRFRNNALWLGDEDDEQSGPICSTCYGKENLVVRMDRTGDGTARCHSCRKQIRFAPAKNPPRDPPARGRRWATDY